jgi:release factor glutamine methyltransferase
VTLQTALQQGVAILEKASVPVARLTAEVLLCHALRSERAYLYAHANDELTENVWIHYGRYLNERLSGKPTQYITQRQEFFGRQFYVNADVLIPRPETEHLAEAAIAYAKRSGEQAIVDVGTGSGAIAVSVALALARPVFASDISLAALQVAARNVRMHAAPVALFACDLLEAVRRESIDLLISNPPYIPGADSANMQTEVRDWEPQVALFAGDTGFEIYSRLIAQAEEVVKPGGRMYLELGYRSLDGVREMLAARWAAFEVISDLAGWPRVIGATLCSP